VPAGSIYPGAHVAKPLMTLIAGPYRSGTNDDPALIQQTLVR